MHARTLPSRSDPTHFLLSWQNRRIDVAHEVIHRGLRQLAQELLSRPMQHLPPSMPPSMPPHPEQPPHAPASPDRELRESYLQGATSRLTSNKI